MTKQRNRRSALRARASTLAVMTGLALILQHQKAMAAFTIDPAYNASSCVLNINSTTVAPDGFGNSIKVQNDGFLGETAKPGLTVSNSTLSGSVLNQGNITFGPPGCSNSGGSTILTNSGGPGAAEFVNSAIEGGVFNQGTIDSTQNGIAFESSSIGVITNSASTVVFENTSTATAGKRAVSFWSGSVYGTISNTTGYIEGGSDAGIHVEQMTVTGSILNSGIVKSLNSNAIYVADTSVGGRIFNNEYGQIAGSPSGGAGIGIGGVVTLTEGLQNEGSVTGYYGIAFNAQSFTGDVTNRGDGEIVGSVNGISGSNEEFTGDIRNEDNGVIEGQTGVGLLLTGINPNSGSYIGDIYNGPNARISGAQGGISLSLDTIESNFDNQGLVELTGTESLSASMFPAAAAWFDAATKHTGSYKNSGTIDGTSQSGAAGIVVSGGEINANVVNQGSGVISGSSASGGVGIFVGATTLNGDVLNSGIVNGAAGIAIGPNPFAVTPLELTGTVFNGDLTNSGSVNGTLVGVTVFAKEWTGDFLNDVNANIGATAGDGADFRAQTWTGNFTNNGAIGGGAEIASNVWNGDLSTANGSTISNDYGTGLTIGAGAAEVGSLLFGSILDWTGDFTHNGSIAGATNGSTISLNSFSGSFVNNGSFAGTSDTGLSIVANTWNGDWTNNANASITGGITGARIEAGTIAGDFTNDGTITGGGVTTGWKIVAEQFTGDIVNNGDLSAQGDALRVDVTTMSGSIANNGTVTGGAGVYIADWTGNFTTGIGSQIVNGDGVALQVGGRVIEELEIVATGSNLNWTGDFNSQGVMSGSAAGLVAAIDQFTGNWTNFGEITGGTGSASGTGIGVEINANDWNGNWTNAAGARIAGDDAGVYIGANTITGNVKNSGTIVAGQSESILALVPNQPFESHAATGLVWVAQNALQLEAGTMIGDVVNENLIDGGASLAMDTWTGDFKNANGAQIKNVNGDGLRIGSLNRTTLVSALAPVEALQWTGDFTNDGLIQGVDGNGGTVSVGSFSGSFTNAGSITGTAASFSATGLYVSAETWNGDFTNAIGATISGAETGFLFEADDVTGTFTNNGTITGGGLTTGWHVVAGTFTGDIVNGASGVLDAPSLAWHLEIDELNGDVQNDGLIEALATNGVAALLASNGGSGSYNGTFTNNGSIKGGTGTGGAGLKVDVDLSGGVVNTGLLKGSTAYDTSDALDATAFTQQGANALVDGNMQLSSNYADTVTFKGGALKGSIFGGEGDRDDDVTVDVGANSFAFHDNVVSNIDDFTAQSGSTLLGALTAGTDGLGMTMTANAVTVKSGATLYLDDNAVVNTNGLDIETGANLTYFLTQNVNQHGVINVAGAPNPLNNLNVLAASGQANVAGTIQAHLNDYGAFRTSGTSSFLYTGVINTTDGVTGTFDAVAYAGLVPLGFQYQVQAIYNPDSVDLLLTRTAYSDLIDPEAESQNQEEVGTALDDLCQTATEGSELEAFCNYVGLLDENEIPGAFDEVSGYQFPQLAGLGLDLTELLTLPSNENNVHGTAFGTCQQAGLGWCGRQMYAQLNSPATVTDAMPDEDPFAWLRPGKREVGKSGLWGRYVGNWRNVEGDVNARGMRAQTNGFAAGFDSVVAENLMVGVSGLYADTSSKFAGAPADEGDISTYQAGVYASWGDADFYVNANSTLIWNEFDTRRRIQTGLSTFAFADGQFDGFGGTAFVELGSVYEEDGFRFQPLASLFYMTHTTDEFTETGAPGLNLIVRETSTDSLRSQLGGRLSHPFKWGETRIVPELRAAWRHEFLDVRHDSNVAFAHAPAVTMTIVGSDHSRDQMVLGFGMSASLGRSTVIYSDVDGAFSDDKNSVQASIGLRHSW